MATDRPAAPVARAIPEDYGAPPDRSTDTWLRYGGRRPLTPEEAASPEETLLRRLRCCGAPQQCGALCMDSEEDQAGARIVRRLDDAERTVAAVGELLRRLDDSYRAGSPGVDVPYVLARLRSVLDAGRLT